MDAQRDASACENERKTRSNKKEANSNALVGLVLLALQLLALFSAPDRLLGLDRCAAEQQKLLAAKSPSALDEHQDSSN